VTGAPKRYVEERADLSEGEMSDGARTGVEESSRSCRVCGRTFPEPRLLALHRGVRHPDTLTDAELSAYREAYREEESALQSFRLRALGGLVLLYFGFLFLYATVAA